MEKSPLRRLCHWGPLIVLGIIKLITWAMIHLLGMWWPPLESFGGALHAALFLNLAACTVYFFLHSLIEGPGIVPVGWKPDDKQARKYLQFCTVCKGYKPPRAHHCRTCGNCIMKMDHHCPWINNCVGHANHGFFIMFLTSAVSGCFQATIVLTICMYHAINRVWYQRHGTGQEPIIHLTLTTLPLTLLAIGMALGVVLAVGVLLYFQVVGILKNQTTIEEWIVEKALVRRARVRLPPFVFPYDMGPDTNLRLALTGEGNGLWWPIRSGCGPYDLTLEQIEQKKDKRRRAVVCVCLRGYSGWWLPLLDHPRAATAPPCSAEPRLPLAPGQRLTVTRYRRHWLYGELLEETSLEGEGRGPRGWFPRACVYTPRHKPD